MSREDELNEMNNILDGIDPKDDKEGNEEEEENTDLTKDNEGLEESEEVDEAEDDDSNDNDKVDGLPTPNPVISDDSEDVISSLKAELAELKALIKPAKEEPKEAILEDLDFVGEVDIDEVIRDPKEFNKVLNQVYKKGFSEYKQRIEKDLPSIIQNQVMLLRNIEAVKDKFFNENQDLVGFPKILSVVYEEIVEANKNKTLEQIMQLTASEARKRLNLKAPIKELKDKKAVDLKDRKAPKLPSGGGKGGRSSTKPDLSGIENEIDLMNNSLGGI